MYKYYLYINMKEENKNQITDLEVGFHAYDQIDAEKIANLITENLANFNCYTLYRRESKLIKKYKKQ